MNILLTTVSLDREAGGGTAQRTFMLVRSLTAAGAACRVVAIEDGALGESLRREGTNAAATGCLRIPYHLPLINPWKLDRLVREADAIHILGYWNLLSVFVAWRARRRGRAYLLSAAGEFAALASGHPIKRVFHRLFGRAMIDGAAALVAVTKLEKRRIVEELGIAADRVLVLPNGVEIPPRADNVASPVVCGPYVLFVGRLAEIKGPDLLLEAFARIAARERELALVLAGPDFGLRARLEERCVELGLQGRVHFTGFLDETARQAAYSGALLVAVPSRDEAMSLVALEAGALGRPVLLTDRCGFDEVAAHGGGLVVEASVDGLARGLSSMLAERGRLDQMGAALLDLVVRSYAWGPLGERLLGWLKSRPDPAPRLR